MFFQQASTIASESKMTPSISKITALFITCSPLHFPDGNKIIAPGCHRAGSMVQIRIIEPALIIVKNEKKIKRFKVIYKYFYIPYIFD
jgi:hypothetical protein